MVFDIYCLTSFVKYWFSLAIYTPDSNSEMSMTLSAFIFEIKEPLILYI